MERKKPYTYTISTFHGDMKYTGPEMIGVSRAFVEGYLTRHLMDYPSKRIEVVRSDGHIYFTHKGNGTPRVS